MTLQNLNEHGSGARCACKSCCFGFRVYDLGFRVLGLGFWVYGLGFWDVREQDVLATLAVSGLGFGVWGLGFGLGFGV
jgi:hypothetical protein